MIVLNIEPDASGLARADHFAETHSEDSFQKYKHDYLERHLQLIRRGLNAHLMSSLANVSKGQLANRAENLKERATDAVAMTNGIMVANGAALAAGFMGQKMGGDGDWQIMGLPVVATAGTALAAAAMLGWIGKKGRKTALNVSIGLTAPYLEKLGRQLAKKA